MSKKKKKRGSGSVREAPERKRSAIMLADPAAYDLLCGEGYTRLDRNPEVISGVRCVADLISSLTIHLMSNTSKGDVRIINELSRKIDINPNRFMTRKTFVDAVVMNLLLYGNGNSVVRVHTSGGLIEDLEPVPASRVSYHPEGMGYYLRIDGRRYDADEVVHCVWNPKRDYPWMGDGLEIPLRELVKNLNQARKTENAFMSSKYKPPLIVKFDGIAADFGDPAGRKKLTEEYLETVEEGMPWLIPADLIDVKEIRPLSLADLAINDTVAIDKRTVASLLGVPPFVLGVGEYNQQAWNNFVNTKIGSICKSIEQAFTKGLILSPKWYFRFNRFSLLEWDAKEITNVYCQLFKSGVVLGNEIRDKLGMGPLDGLDKPIILENYIPVEEIGNQKKLKGGGDDD